MKTLIRPSLRSPLAPAPEPLHREDRLQSWRGALGSVEAFLNSTHTADGQPVVAPAVPVRKASINGARSGMRPACFTKLDAAQTRTSHAAEIVNSMLNRACSHFDRRPR